MAGNTEYKNKWMQDNLDRINLTIPKGQKEIIKKYAQARGESVNAFVNRAIQQTMKMDKGVI